MQMCHWSHAPDGTEPEDRQACQGCCVEMFMTGGLKFWLGKEGPRKAGVWVGRGQLGKEHRLLLGIKSVLGTVWSPEPSSLG